VPSPASTGRSVPWVWCEDLASGPSIKPKDFWPNDRYDLALVDCFAGREIARVACSNCHTRVGGLIDGPLGATLWMLSRDRHAPSGYDCRGWFHATEPGAEVRPKTTVVVAFRFIDPPLGLVQGRNVGRLRERLGDDEICTALCYRAVAPHLTYVTGGRLHRTVREYRRSGSKQNDVVTAKGNPWVSNSAYNRHD